jgi:hypothetical protein
MKFRCHEQHESVPVAAKVNDPEFAFLTMRAMQARATIGTRSFIHGSNKVQAFPLLGGVGRDA